MKLIHQVLQFYKMAADQAPPTQQEYEKWLSHSLTGAPLDIISAFMNRHHTKPWFKVEDFLYELYSVLEVHYEHIGYLQAFILDLQTRGKLPDYLINTIKRWLASEWLNKHTEIDLNDYFVYEDDAPNLMRQAQNALMRHLWKSLKEEGSKAWKDAILELTSLLEESAYFPKKFIWQLIKHFGIGAYVGVQHQRELGGWDYKFKQNKALNRDKINVFKMAEIYANNNTFTIKEFLELILRCDEKAAEYMRGFVYYEASTKDNPSNYFMLDEEMRPLNEDYQVIGWPVLVGWSAVEELPPEIQAKWRSMFIDFKIVPQTSAAEFQHTPDFLDDPFF